MAKEVAQLMQSWLLTQPVADTASQQRILELEAELAKVKSSTNPDTATPAETPGTSSTPIGRALQGQQAASIMFDPSCLLVSPGSVDPWLVENQPTSLTDTQYKKWLKDMKLPPHKLTTLEKQLEKVTNWWNSQPDESAKTIQRASVAMGIDTCKLKNSSTDETVLKVSQGHDGGDADELLTSQPPEFPGLKSSPHHERPRRCSCMYFVVSSAHPVYFVSFD